VEFYGIFSESQKAKLQNPAIPTEKRALSTTIKI
jgi:hypothetical protein